MDTPEQVVSEISQRIAQLENLSVENLKGEMQSLKQALMENPAACLLLHDEDIGKTVVALRKLTGMAISSASSKKEKAPKAATKKRFTAEELAAALDDI